MRLPKSPRFSVDSCRPINRVARIQTPSERRLVDFQLYHPKKARSVKVVGNFSEGCTDTVPLEHLGGGAWVARLLLPPGRYEYHFMVDGRRRPDPLAVHVVQTQAGVLNAVVRVE